MDADLSEALEAIRPRLLRYAKRATWHAHDAEDAVQEALCRAMSHADLRLEGLPAWLSRVTTNILVDYGRRQRHSTLVADTSLPEEPVPDPADDVVDRQMARSMLDLVLRLSDNERDILLLLAAGESVQRIACRTGATSRSVEGHLRRARKKLRRCAT